MIRRRVSAALLVATIGLAVPAHADDANQRRAIVELGRPRHVPSALDSVPHPWPGRALLLSAAGTAIPIAIATRPHPHSEARSLLVAMLAAETITPAAGHLYAGLGRRALAGIAVRGIGFGITVAGLPPENSDDITYGALAALFGMVMIGTSAVVDVVTVSPDVERKNQAWLAAHSAVGVRLLEDQRTPALALDVHF